MKSECVSYCLTGQRGPRGSDVFTLLPAYCRQIDYYHDKGSQSQGHGYHWRIW